MQIQHFYDAATGTLTYVVHDGRHSVVLDPVLDYDPAAGRTSRDSANSVADYINEHALTVEYVIDTHAHADHLTALPFFRERFGAKSVTGAGIVTIQSTFRGFFNLPPDFPVDGRQFDVLLDEGDTLTAGSLTVQAMHTPGHTPAHMSWQIGDAVFLGDTLFMPDYGTARCDFPGGSAAVLFDSVQRIYALPDSTRLYACHDYLPQGRELKYLSTVAEQKADNIHLNAQTSKADFIRLREARDAGLPAPRLLLPSLQVNIRAGELPPPESNAVSYLKIPLNALGRDAPDA